MKGRLSATGALKGGLEALKGDEKAPITLIGNGDEELMGDGEARKRH